MVDENAAVAQLESGPIPVSADNGHDSVLAISRSLAALSQTNDPDGRDAGWRVVASLANGLRRIAIAQQPTEPRMPIGADFRREAEALQLQSRALSEIMNETPNLLNMPSKCTQAHAWSIEAFRMMFDEFAVDYVEAIEALSPRMFEQMPYELPETR